GFRIEENGGDDGLQIATHAAAVVVEDLGNTADISGTRIAGDQFLNQLLANKWAHVGVIENVLQAGVEIGLDVAAGGKHHAVQQYFGGLAVVLLVRKHGAAEIAPVEELGGLPRRGRIRPAGENLTEAVDCVLPVSWDQVAAFVEYGRAIDIEFCQA